MKTILVVGGAGYVGSGLLRDLLNNGDKVVCLDSLMFGGESILGLWHHPNFSFHKCDMNDSGQLDEVLSAYSYDAVILLAAIVGDPACKQNADLAYKTNWESSVYLINKAIELGIPKFVFASTCSNYGKMSDSNSYVSEESDLAPVSLYAELKVKFEDYILNQLQRSEKFCPTVLRFSTVYGLSPRMRFDLTVNEFSKELALGNELVVFGEEFWRPYCHVKDFSRAFMTVLDSPYEKVAYNVYNVGDTSENYTKKMLVDAICKEIPEAKISYVKKNEDPRDYRVNSDKIKEELGFEISMRVPDGIREVIKVVREGVINDTEDQRYYNIPHKK